MPFLFVCHSNWFMNQDPDCRYVYDLEREKKRVNAHAYITLKSIPMENKAGGSTWLSVLPCFVCCCINVSINTIVSSQVRDPAHAVQDPDELSCPLVVLHNLILSWPMSWSRQLRGWMLLIKQGYEMNPTVYTGRNAMACTLLYVFIPDLVRVMSWLDLICLDPCPSQSRLMWFRAHSQGRPRQTFETDKFGSDLGLVGCCNWIWNWGIRLT